MDPIDNIPEHLKCPICLEVPKNKVFQCREGHSLCEECYSQISNCPQCRIPFDSTPIRTLVVEKMLDELQLECPYKEAGCKKLQVNRKNLRDHSQQCSHNIAKYGPFVNVCKVISSDFGNCDFQMNKGNVLDSVEHFKSCHKASVLDKDIFRMNVADVTKYKAGGRKCIILYRKDEGYAYLILLNITGGEKHCVSMSAFYWRCQSQNNANGNSEPTNASKVKCSMKGDNSLSWSVSPVDILKCGEEDSPTFSINMPAFAFVEKPSNKLSIVVKLKRDGD